MLLPILITLLPLPALGPSLVRGWRQFQQHRAKHGVTKTLATLLTDPTFAVLPFAVFAYAVLAAETVLGVLIIQHVPYTEIDWVAYMQEVSGVLSGEMDYTKLGGNTGPLVYPAGFVYLYALLYKVTGDGVDIVLAQYIFLGVYVVFVGVLLLLYRHTRVVPPYALLLLCASRRVHSIFMLRLFNDGVTMLLLYAAILMMVQDRWNLGCLLFTFALSIKMNVLLFVPALALLLTQRFGFVRACVQLLVFVVGGQALLGLPFLLTFPAEYFGRAFEFGREFKYLWTVNLKFFPPHMFVSSQLALTLLAMHVTALLVFGQLRWARADKGLLGLVIGNFTRPRYLASPEESKAAPTRNLSAERIVTVMFECNMLGIICARSLHYQFYVWYFHTLPFLLWRSNVDVYSRVFLLGCIEAIWNLYPPTPLSSLALTALHFVLFLLVALSKPPAGPLRADELRKRTE